MIWSRFLAAVVAVFIGIGGAAAQAPMQQVTPAGINGGDYSANAGSLSGLTLLNTIPAIQSGSTRRGYIVQAQCAAGLTLSFDDGTSGATLIVLAGGASDGAQGGAVDYTGLPHAGRIRIYSSNASCQMAARAW